jgi:hypothetical protein
MFVLLWALTRYLPVDDEYKVYYIGLFILPIVCFSIVIFNGRESCKSIVSKISISPLKETKNQLIFISLFAFQICLQYFVLNIFLGEKIEHFNAMPWYHLTVIFISVCIIGPISEEILFRGYLFNKLYEKKGYLFSLIVSSIIFSLFHVDPNFYHTIFLFISGIILGFLFKRTNSLFIPILFHILWNLFVTITSL